MTIDLSMLLVALELSAVVVFSLKIIRKLWLMCLAIIRRELDHFRADLLTDFRRELRKIRDEPGGTKNKR